MTLEQKKRMIEIALSKKQEPKQRVSFYLVRRFEQLLKNN